MKDDGGDNRVKKTHRPLRRGLICFFYVQYKQNLPYRDPEKHLFLCFFARDRFPPQKRVAEICYSPSKGIVVAGFS